MLDPYRNKTLIDATFGLIGLALNGATFKFKLDLQTITVLRKFHIVAKGDDPFVEALEPILGENSKTAVKVFDNTVLARDILQLSPKTYSKFKNASGEVSDIFDGLGTLNSVNDMGRGLNDL